MQSNGSPAPTQREHWYQSTEELSGGALDQYFSPIYFLHAQRKIRGLQLIEMPAMKTLRNQNPKRSKLVVVIDDDPLVLDATEGLLRTWGCEVVAAESYRTALHKLDGRRPDLIVCDYRLPQGENGLEAIEGLRSAFEIPALLISGDPIAPSGEGAGNYQLLHKPLDPTRFRTALIDISVLQSRAPRA